MKLNRIFIKVLAVMICLVQGLLLGNFLPKVKASEGDLVNNTTKDKKLEVYSEAAILIEQETGKILYKKNIDKKMYPASTTKILTAILAIEKCDLNESVIASKEAVRSIKTGYSNAAIQVGESFTVEELLKVLMVHSANEAGNILAEHISGSVEEFAKLMNVKAKEIGCENSNFVNPHGMHEDNHYTTAYDLALIGRYAMQNEKFRQIVSTMECSLPNTELWTEEHSDRYGERKFYNTNDLMLSNSKHYYPYVTGIKSGYTTPAKNCLVTGSNRYGFELVCVVLHAETTELGESARNVDTINLLEYGYKNFNKEDIISEYNYQKEQEKGFITGVVKNSDDDIDKTGKTGMIELNTTTIVKNVIKIGSVLSFIGLVCLYVYKKKKEHKEFLINEYSLVDLYNFNLDTN